MKLSPYHITMSALAAINCLLALYILGVAYLAYFNEELSFKLIGLLTRVMGV